MIYVLRLRQRILMTTLLPERQASVSRMERAVAETVTRHRDSSVLDAFTDTAMVMQRIDIRNDIAASLSDLDWRKVW